jgi:hypothetical protein
MSAEQNRAISGDFAKGNKVVCGGFVPLSMRAQQVAGGDSDWCGFHPRDLRGYCGSPPAPQL